MRPLGVDLSLAPRRDLARAKGGSGRGGHGGGDLERGEGRDHLAIDVVHRLGVHGRHDEAAEGGADRLDERDEVLVARDDGRAVVRGRDAVDDRPAAVHGERAVQPVGHDLGYLEDGRLHERVRGRRREPDRLSDGNLGRLLERLCRAGGQLVRRGERDRRRRGGEREENRLGGRVGQREGGDDVEAEGAVGRRREDRVAGGERGEGGGRAVGALHRRRARKARRIRGLPVHVR
mmetsp:Transcript_41961/g.138185  ORF Transcript_41961/g.138185 Transcript_41961/m.138185 type:complete len:234 (+) Transcript_41961:90-791(+)